MSHRSSPHVPAASASASSSSSVASSASSSPSNEEEQKALINADPSPIHRMHRHALESILGFCTVSGLATAMRVSKEWNAAVRTMPSIRFAFPVPSAAHLLLALHSPLARHIGVIDVRWARTSPWSASPAIKAQLSTRLAQLSDLSCADDQAKLTATFDVVMHAHALVTQLCVCCPTLESLLTVLLTPLADLRTISERLPQLHTLHLRLPSEELMKHLIVVTRAQRRSAVLEGLDAVDVIPDLAALCAEYVQADPTGDARLTVAFLPQRIRDVGLLIRQTDSDNQAFLQLTTAVVLSLHALPQLTALKLDLMPWEGINDQPPDSLPGFDWELLGVLTALTSLSLCSTCSDQDYGVAIAWDEAAAIAAFRKLTQLTALDVSGFTRPSPPPRLFDGDADDEAHDDAATWIEDERAKYAFDIVSFARPPVAHPSLRDLSVTCEWGDVVWTAAQCAAFRRLPMLQWIDGEPIEQVLGIAAKPIA